MIVVSGALVLVALVLLIIGLLGDGLLLIWLSIGTSVVAGVFLLLGALQRRGAPAPVADMPSGPDMLERVTAVSVRPREEVVEPAPVEDAVAAVGMVSVVPGRPRYHVAACRFLTGRPDVESIKVDEARAEGYTACGICKPDAALAAEGAGEMPEPVVEEVVEAAPPARKAPAKRATAAAAATKAPAKRTATATAEKPAKAAAKATTAATGNQVVVIPDRGKFHMATCRFVKDVPGTVTVTKATAKRQGYTPCGVCKP